jgi:hypothetical protein
MVGSMAIQTPTPAAVSLAPEERDLVVEVVDALQPRLQEVAPDSLRGMVASALDELGEVRVTTYLPIIVERRVRQQLRLEQAGRIPA